MEQRCEVTGSVEEMKRTPPLTPSPVPFVIDVPEDALADLHERLERARLPDWPVGGGWTFGTDKDYLERLIRYWLTNFDWRKQERRLNRFPQIRIDIDGLNTHAVHCRSTNESALPLLLSHGWPGWFFESHIRSTLRARVRPARAATSLLLHGADGRGPRPLVRVQRSIPQGQGKMVVQRTANSHRGCGSPQPFDCRVSEGAPFSSGPHGLRPRYGMPTRRSQRRDQLAKNGDRADFQAICMKRHCIERSKRAGRVCELPSQSLRRPDAAPPLRSAS